MLAVDMEFLTERGEVGDCVKACTASILEIDPATVPHFVRDHYSDWRGPWEEWLESDPRQRPICLYLACGPTVRCKEYRPAAHMVVMNWTKVEHDPHPSRAGLTSIDRVYLLVPTDPAILSAQPAREQETAMRNLKHGNRDYSGDLPDKETE